MQKIHTSDIMNCHPYGFHLVDCYNAFINRFNGQIYLCLSVEILWHLFIFVESFA